MQAIHIPFCERRKFSAGSYRCHLRWNNENMLVSVCFESFWQHLLMENTPWWFQTFQIPFFLSIFLTIDWLESGGGEAIQRQNSLKWFSLLMRTIIIWPNNNLTTFTQFRKIFDGFFIWNLNLTDWIFINLVISEFEISPPTRFRAQLFLEKFVKMSNIFSSSLFCAGCQSRFPALLSEAVY